MLSRLHRNASAKAWMCLLLMCSLSFLPEVSGVDDGNTSPADTSAADKAAADKAAADKAAADKAAADKAAADKAAADKEAAEKAAAEKAAAEKAAAEKAAAEKAAAEKAAADKAAAEKAAADKAAAEKAAAEKAASEKTAEKAAAAEKRQHDIDAAVAAALKNAVKSNPYEQSPVSQAFHWMGFVAMVMSAAVVLGLMSGFPTEKRQFHMVSFFLIAISAYAFFGMAQNQGMVVRKDGRMVFWGRYAEWLFTQPLSVCLLGMLIGASNPAVLGVVGCCWLNVVASLASTFTGSPDRYLWFGISLMALFPIMSALVGPFRSYAHQKVIKTAATSPKPFELKKVYTLLSVLLLVCWAVPPFVWILGDGLRLTSVEFDTIVYTLLAVLTKPVFVVLLLSKRDVLEQACETGQKTTELLQQAS